MTSCWARLMLLITVGVILSTLGCVEKPEQKTEMVLSNYAKLFEKDVIIVIGENATQIEMEGARVIADDLGNLTGNEPVIKEDVEITGDELAGHNLILVGGTDLNEVYDMTDAMRVTEEYPGAGKGVLEVLRSPWDPEKAMLLVAGSDENGTDIMSQVATQTEKIHLKRIYGPYAGYKYSRSSGMLGLPNPSAEYCKKLGYKHKIKTLEDGSQIGYCIFEDSIFGKKECPAWDFFIGLCGEEYMCCTKSGGVVVRVSGHCWSSPTCAMCVLPSGKICYEWDYAMGGCE